MAWQAGRGEALADANRLLLPLLRAVKRYNLSCRRCRRDSTMATRLLQTGDRRVHILVVDIPASNPLVIAVYTSVQRSRPASPSQVLKRVRRLVEAVKRLRGRVFNAADILYFYLSRTRLTRNAYRAAVKAGVHVALTPVKAAEMLSRYLKSRLDRLREALKGKRVWGVVERLLHSLETLYTELQPTRLPELLLQHLQPAETLPNSTK